MNASSGMVGVQYVSTMKTRPWCAQIYLNGKTKKLGYFKSPEEASAVYEKAREERDRLPESVVVAMCEFEKENPDARCVPLTQGQFAIVDDSDYERISKFKWFARYDPHTNSYYAARGYPKRIYMAREIMNAPDDVKVDHESHITTDNRKQNLRFADDSRSCQNRGTFKNNKSGYKGVHKVGNRWRASIQVSGRRFNLGSFPTPELAYEAYCKAAPQFHREFACLG